MRTKKIWGLFMVSLFALWGCNKTVPEGIYADIVTNKGTMRMKLFYKATPVTVANFVSLAEGTNPMVPDSIKGKKFYEDIIFHRVIKDFVCQGGDPTGTGMGGPGYKFRDEIVDTLKHGKKGILSMANSGPETNGSQFFITLKELPHLDKRHTVFGVLINGEQVLDSIGATVTSQEAATRDKPLEDIVIEGVKIYRGGGDAKNFDAPKVFMNYFKNIEELKQRTIAEFESQKVDAEVLPSGVRVLTLEKGTVERPNEGDRILVNYSGFMEKEGKIFATSWLKVAEEYGIVDKSGTYRPMPSVYSKEAGLIPGFKEAMLRMSIGQKIRVFIPSDMGYGETGSGPIPPNTDLVFDIEIVKKEGK